jgi:hypothetical protein
VGVTPRWSDATDHDPGVTLLELLAYAGDMLSYYQDRVAEEQRLRTRGFVTFTLAALLILIFWRRRRPDGG